MTDRCCPRCHNPVEPIYAKGKHAVWDGSRLWECVPCSTAWPERELAPAPEAPFNERAEVQEYER